MLPYEYDITFTLIVINFDQKFAQMFSNDWMEIHLPLT